MVRQIAVITGAYGGLGAEISRQLAAASIGLVFVDRDKGRSDAFAAELNARAGNAVLATYQVDLSRHDEVSRLAREICGAFPQIDFLFNNAGVLTETLETSGHGNELHFEVNTLAPLALIDGLRPSLRAANGAVIVNTSAGLSLRAKTLDLDELIAPRTFRKLYGPYVRSKAALNVLTAALAPELTFDNIRIRAADPGPNQTRLTRGGGTPLWMRLFYRLLPTPDKGAAKIVDAALGTGWHDATGIFISGGAVKPLPVPLTDPLFQAHFLEQCRARAAIGA